MTITSKRLSDKAKPWITKALKEYGKNDEIIWDMGFVTFPDPAAPDPLLDSTDPSGNLSLIPALLLYLEIPTGDSTTPSVYMNAILAPYSLNEVRVSEAIKSTLETLRDARDKFLSSK